MEEITELTKALNHGCFYLTLKWGESLYLNSCIVQSAEKQNTRDGNPALLLTTERGRFWAVMYEGYWEIENPTPADIYENCVTVKDYCGM